MHRWEQTIEFTKRIQLAMTVEAICDELLTLTSQFGLTRLIAGTIPAPHLAPSAQKSNILFAGWPEEWMRRYVARSYAYVDPVLYQVTATPGTAFRWSDAAAAPGREREATRMMHEAGDHGLHEGFAVPLVTLEGDIATVSFGGEEMELPPEAAGLIHLVGIYAIGRAFQLQDREKIIYEPLTTRELDVLRWCAEGKTAWEISVILGVAESTIRSHLNAARSKFGAANSTALVADAIRVGLIK